MPSANMQTRVAFIDRDGVINVDHGYVHRVEDFELIPGSVDSLKALCEWGYRIVVVTNQGGVARGLYPERDFLRLNRHMLQLFAEHGVSVAEVCFCPHHPEGTMPEYAKRCAARKPGTDMLSGAAKRLNANMARSILIGDKPSDTEAGVAAGVGANFLIVGTPQGHQAIAEKTTRLVSGLIDVTTRFRRELTPPEHHACADTIAPPTATFRCGNTLIEMWKPTNESREPGQSMPMMRAAASQK
jgi:D-glycero-D-manno-heptose 1,7-bisphosphate phosphatase